MKRFARYYLPFAAVVVLITLGLGQILSRAELDKLKVHEASYLAAAREVLLSALKTPLDHLRGLEREPQVQQALSSSPPQDRSLMAQQLLTLLYRNPAYEQARWLNAAGWEIARVSYGQDGAVIVPEADLRDRSTRHYYQQAIRLAPGQTYLSPVDLDVEQGVVDIPYRPILRLAIRLPVVEGRDQGLLVIDLLAQPLLDHLRRLAVTGREPHAMVLNPQGNWLMAPDPEDAWGIMFGRDTGLSSHHPTEWAAIRDQTEGQLLTPSGLWSWTTLAPGATYPEAQMVAEDWKLVTQIGAGELWDRQWPRWWPLLLIAACALALLALGVWLYLRQLGARERGQAELALAKEQRITAELDHMRLLMQEAETIAHLGAWEYLVATQATVWSPGECRIYGLDPTTPAPDYGAMLQRCIHPEDAARLDEAFSAALAAQAPFALEHRIRRPDGSERLVQDLAYPVLDDQGRLVRYVGATLDITERRQAELQLAATTRHLQALLDALPVAVAFTDGRDAGHIQANRTFFQWYEMAPGTEVSASAPEATAPGRQMRYFHAGQELEADALPLQRALSEGRATAALELEIVLPSGRRWISETTAVPIHDGEGEVIGGLAVLVDITARKHAEAALSDLNANLEREVAARTAELEAARAVADAASRAKSEFLAHMSHEIRTPLNAVLGQAQLLGREPLSADQRLMVQRLQTAGQSLLGIINDILDLSKLEAGQLRLEIRPFTLETLIAKLHSLLGPTAHAKGLDLRLAPPAEPVGPLLGDPLRLEQVLTNLVGNALKFTEQGEVVLRITPLAARDRRLGLRFAIQDTGIGIEPAALQRLFSPFTQADNSITRRFGGTGLGLSISKRLVEAMGGQIGVESTPGQGSTFWFEVTLPRAMGSEPAEPATAPPPPNAGPRLTGLHLLAVDDSSMNRDLVEMVLSHEGACVTLAVDGQQAVQILQASPAGFDAVLMDVQMPVMDGRTATRLIRRELGLTQLPVIALTAGVLAEEQRLIREAGADEVLAKPLDLELLVATLLRRIPAGRLRAGETPGAAPAGPPASLDAFPRIPGIDHDRAAQISGHDPTFFRTQLARLLSEAAGVGSACRQALAAGDRETAARRLHGLKGSAGNLGARDLMRAAGELELAIQHEAGDLDAGLAALDRQLGDLATASAPGLATDAAALLAATPAPPLDPDRLSLLREALRAHDLAASDHFEALAASLTAAWGVETSQALGQAIADRRFDEALVLLVWCQLSRMDR